jgi:hypothetical protein
MSTLLLKNKDGILYAVAYEVISPKGEILKCDFEYMHAENAAHARFKFFAGNPTAGQRYNLGLLRISSIGPVIGVKALDEHGDKMEI